MKVSLKADKKKQRAKGDGVFLVLWGGICDYVSKSWSVLALILAAFLFSAALAFVKVSTAATVSSFDVNRWEVGQVSDVTIVSPKAFPPDYENPISIAAGEKIIRKGFPITQDALDKLKKMATSPIYVDYRAFANSTIYFALIAALFFFLFSKIYFRDKKIEFKELATECCLYALVLVAVVFGMKSSRFATPYAICALIPSALCVFLTAILFGQLNALFFSIIISLAVLNVFSYETVPFIFTLTTSLAATRLVRKIDRRTDMVLVSGMQALLNMVFLMALKIIFNSPLKEDAWVFAAAALNGFFSGILCLGLLTPLELLLNTASLFRLVDLSDLNNPLMKKMLLTASGTYNHSLMVANLAEAACNEVGANSLLARVGAYYHDIGKIDNPEYFVENQTGENIHDEINPSLSVSIIRSHVKRGVEKARAMRLPQQIIDIISEHHGNQVIAYFYNEAKQANPDAKAEDYSYTGSPPRSKESAIVMLADTVEAACRSLEKPSVPRLEKFVTTLIRSKIDHNQLENCTLTFSDLSKIHGAFIQILAGYYHSRTKYPDQKDPDEDTKGGAAQDSQSTSDDKKTQKTDKASKGDTSDKTDKEQKVKKAT